MFDVTKRYADYISNGSSYFDGKIKVTFFGTTTYLFDDGKTKILFDAMVTRPNLLKFVLFDLNSNKKLVDELKNKFEMNDLDAMFISHSHYDHILDAASFANKEKTVVYGSSSSVNVVLGNGVKKENTIVFKANESYKVGDFNIKVLNSIHSKPNRFNNDLGIEISQPFSLPASKKKFTEGGSFDFLIEHGGRSILLRPSCNYIIDSLNGIKCDVLILSVGQFSKLSEEEKEIFYKETIDKVKPQLVIPTHYDNFFVGINKANNSMFKFIDDTKAGLDGLIKRTNSLNCKMVILSVFDHIRI